jgi:uncharacterized protein (TIGR02444 family)
MSTPSHETTEDSPFWRFSLRFYARPKVASACLALQDEAGADVNLLLFLLFLADHERQISAEDIAGLDQRIVAWRSEVVKPLRALRRALKSGIGKIPIAVSETFRAQIKRLELESERIEQHELEGIGASSLGARAQSRSEAARTNVAAYEAYLGGFLPEARAAILSGFEEFLAHATPRQN